jgi:hypothetical protein
VTEATERVSTATLLAEIEDVTITARTLEYWRHKGLLPNAERTGQAGKHPEWTYPTGTREQLGELMHLRERTKQPDLLRAGLWFRGFPVATNSARTSIAAALRDTQTKILKEVDKRRDPSLPPEESTWAALHKLGRTLARKRGRDALPRIARQPQDDRDSAVTLLLALVIGVPDASDRLAQDADKIERMTGVYRGRRPPPGFEAWITGPANEAFQDFQSLASLPALIEAVEAATESELDASRDQARVLLYGISVITRLADALTLTDNAVGLAAWSAFADQPLVVASVTAFVLSARRRDPYRANLQAIVEALTSNALPAAAQAEELAALSDEELSERLPNLNTLPFVQKAGLMNLIAKYRDDPVTQTLHV